MKRFIKTNCLVKGVMIASVIFFLTNCSPRDLGVYDESVPPEQRCTVIIDQTLKVRKFNDKKVRWGGYYRNKTIQIPAGHHSFIVDYAKSKNNVVKSAKSISVSDELIAGKTYEMKAFEWFDSVSITVKEKR